MLRNALALAALLLVCAAPAQADTYVAAKFDSPSHNISCRIVDRFTGAYVQCAIISFKHTVYMVNNGKPQIVSIRRGDARRQWVLGYGNSITLNRFRCKSLEVGMKCWNRRTHWGFLVSRDNVIFRHF